MARKTRTRLKNLLLWLPLTLWLVSCSGRGQDGTTASSETASTDGTIVESAESAEVDSEAQQRLVRRKAVAEFVQSLDPVERYSQLFLVNLEGNKKFSPVENFSQETPQSDSAPPSEAGQSESSRERPLVPGGYLFFSYNIAPTAAEVAEFTASIQDWCRRNNRVPPLLTLDQEGGLVNRLRSVASVLPSARQVAESMTVAQARELYSLQAAQMASLGFHLNLAPVAEASGQYNEDFLDSRSFGGVPQMESYAAAAIAGFQERGVGAVAKHFPGNTNDDPHSGLPEIDLSREEVEELYLEPFRRVLDESHPWAVLMSHARTAAFDRELPACLSRFWVTEVLRRDFGYEGLVLSDDIFMAALEKNGFPPEKAVMMAVEAGIDVIMLSEKKFGSVLGLLLERSETDKEFASRLDASVERVIAAKIQMGLLALEEDGSDSAADEPAVTLAPRTDWDEAVFQDAYRKGQELHDAVFGGGR